MPTLKLDKETIAKISALTITVSTVVSMVALHEKRLDKQEEENKKEHAEIWKAISGTDKATGIAIYKIDDVKALLEKIIELKTKGK